MSYSELRDEMMRLYGEGKFPQALELVEAQAGHLPERAGLLIFWRMCLLSLMGKPAEVLQVFQQGLDQGHWWHETSFLDTDLDAVRELPEFKRLSAISHEKYLQARQNVRTDRRLLIPDDTSKPLPLLIALHGRNGNAETDLARWEAARQRGWLVLSIQSSQPLSPYAYFWDDGEQGLQDIRLQYQQILQEQTIDRARILMAGFSQGSGMALLGALNGDVPARGFIGVATWWEDPAEIAELAKRRPDLRAYFISGEKDYTLERSREIQSALRENQVAIAEEIHSDIAHEFSVDFADSFEKASAFIFEEAR